MKTFNTATVIVAPMPLGGKLVLKGGHTLQGVKKKKGKKKSQQQKPDAEQHNGEEGKAAGVSATGKTYEEEFSLEMEKAKEGKVKNTPWGSSYRDAPEILHGYTVKVTGKTAEERLDMRAARKSDKFCK